MLRPKQMSKVTVTGSRPYMEQVIEATHDLNLLHVSEYDGSFEGFDVGDPLEGADEASDKLVTVRSIESILDVDEDEAGPTRIVTDEALEEELADVREQVNELDDRREELEDQLQAVEAELETMAPLVDLGIDLDLLGGYRSLQVAVGVGDADEVRTALEAAEGVEAFEVFAGDDAVAAFVVPAGERYLGDVVAGEDDEAADADAADADDADADVADADVADGDDADDVIDEALVGVEFQALEVPDASGSPEDHVAELEREAAELRSRLEDVERDLEELKTDFAGFLLAAEETLSIDIQKREAPLSFATTENAFVAEGWIPTERYDEFAAALDDAVDDHVEVEELERASFKSDGDAAHEAVADGGTETFGADEPPVVQDNNGFIEPFEILVEAVSRPSYREFDPTVLLFLTFPAFFGFMIGDVGYGVIYTLIGWYLYTNFDSDAFRSMGGVTITAGLFTVLFGVLYGEIFGLHLVSTYFWEGLVGLHGSPLHKGLQPADLYWAQAWLVVSTIAALVHLDVGYALGFLEEYDHHGAKAAVLEKGSWLLGTNGLWLFVFSRLFEAKKPDFLFEVFASGDGAAFALGFTGFSPAVGWLGLGMFALGAVLLALGEPAEILEVFDTLVNVLSYTRIAAVLLAKAGMAFVVNLLFFGAYEHHGEFHFMLSHGPEYVAAEYGREAIMFGGLVHGGGAALLVGLLVLVIGHLLVLALGVTSAGLQSIRLEYYEFFTKFYEGGGRDYEPFGYERRFTTEE